MQHGFAPPASTRHPAVRTVRIASAWLAAAIIVMLVAIMLPEPSTTIGFRFAVYGAQGLFSVLLVAAVTFGARAWHVHWSRLTIVLLVALAVATACNVFDVPFLGDAAKIVFGVSAGTLTVRVFERPWWLLPICLLVPISDAWSVYSSYGVTNTVIATADDDPRWIEWPTLATPIAGFPYEAFSRIGIVDVLFMAVLLGCAGRWPTQLGEWRGAVAIVVAMLAATIIVVEGAPVAIPALPLICGLFLLSVLPGVLRDARAEWRASRADRVARRRR